jgi:3-hydroxybutyryl-CoA dehydrogenase
MEPNARKVGVLGTGTMGAGIVQVAAQSGFTVVACDHAVEALERAQLYVRDGLSRFASKGIFAEREAEAAYDHIHWTVNPGEMSEVEAVIEAVVERVEPKKEALAALDALLPHDSLILTNTSSISITELAATTGRPEKFIGMHFFNPVPLMKLVEIARGLQTADETYSAVHELAERLGKEPVEVNDFPGFVSNRVLMPMINEAVYCVMEGVAGPEEVDVVMKLGMNHPIGPLALADLIGLDTCLHIMEVLHEGFGDTKYRPCPLLKRYVAAGQLGRKSGRGFYEYE